MEKVIVTFTEDEMEQLMMAVRYYGNEAKQEGDIETALEMDNLWNKLSKA